MHKRVVVSGYVFANIIHEASKSDGDTEGLLYGNIRQITRDHITDSNSSENHEETEYALFDIIPSEQSFSFYDHVGNVIIDKDQKSDSKLILGWYKIRCNTSNRISMREREVIKNFIKTFHLTNGLIFILCTPQTTSNRSTTAFSYKCFLCSKEEKCPNGLKINIINLGHTGTHPEYRNQSCLIEPIIQNGSEYGASIPFSTAMPLICDSFENSFLQKDGSVYEVHHIRRMYTQTLDIMKKFQENLSDIENEICENENEVAKLREIFDEKRKEKDEVIENNISGKVEFHRSHAEDLKDEEELFTGAKVSKMKLTEKTREESEEAANQF